MPTDSDLYRRWLEARDERAFADLARRHANLVHDVAWRTGGDRGLAEDALQAALLRLATDGTERPVAVGLRAWLARLAISKALNARASARARRRRERAVGPERAEAGMSDDAARRADVDALLERCRRDDAALLALRYLHELPYAEVAAVLGVAEPTARVRVHRALRRARKQLGRKDVDDRRLAGLLAGVPVRAPAPAVLEDGTEEALAIEAVMHRTTTWHGAALVEYPDVVRVQPGGLVALSTSDDRAAFPRVVARVPSPPAELVIRIPARGSFEDTLALEVVDAEHGAPIPDAWLAWGSGDGAGTRVPADRHGRIPVRIPDAASRADEDRPVLWRFGQAEWIVHAPGYRAEGNTKGYKEYVPSVFAENLETWRARGVRRVALEPWPVDGSVRELRVRLLHADGRPAAGAYVLLSWPLRRGGPWPGPWHDGFRRADEDGELTVAVHEVTGLDVRVDHVHLAAWGLAEAAWPAEGPRVLRLPPIADAELVLEGVPKNAAYWRRDALGPKRTPLDGSSFEATYEDPLPTRFFDFRRPTGPPARAGPPGRLTRRRGRGPPRAGSESRTPEPPRGRRVQESLPLSESRRAKRPPRPRPPRGRRDPFPRAGPGRRG